MGQAVGEGRRCLSAVTFLACAHSLNTSFGKRPFDGLLVTHLRWMKRYLEMDNASMHSGESANLAF